ncbi:MAG TPA: TIM barrel protein [Acidobacteriaceae bacterium]|nr:TIM barrel protein [Acidobacteriaceae bacterium]
MKHIGFSSGALALGNFDAALEILRDFEVDSVELSALRAREVEVLISALPRLDLRRYSYVSFHAPSAFVESEEDLLAQYLYSRVPDSWPIVLHPDAIYDFSIWRRFGKRLAIENMDRRKPIGRTVAELAKIFDLLPDARFCFDIGHARQCDASMTEAYFMLKTFGSRIVQVHVSEVNSASQHERVSYAAKLAFQEVVPLLPPQAPLILESRAKPNEIAEELRTVKELFESADLVAAVA